MQIQVNTGNGVENSESLQRWASEHLTETLERFQQDVTRIEVHAITVARQEQREGCHVVESCQRLHLCGPRMPAGVAKRHQITNVAVPRQRVATERGVDGSAGISCLLLGKSAACTIRHRD